MDLKNNMNRIIIMLALSLVSVLSVAQSTGNLKGKIIEKSTKQPVIGANIRINNTQLGTTTDTAGVFVINNIPIGTCAITISSIGFQTKNISEIIITPNKTYYSEIEMLEDPTNLDEITVRTFRGEENPLTPVSTFTLSREEIFRNPGSGGDIMRALAVLPGVVSSGAQFSAIAARGQGTQDNVYMVDDIPMFNLSHLEAEGFNSGFNDPNGGRFSIFAPRVIDNVQFQNGGFDAVNGRKTSSYLGLGIKEGNRENWSFGGQFELLGFTLLADGPISQKTSLFASARYQSLALVQRAVGVENPITASFGDYMLKTTTHINANSKLSFLAIYNPERPYKTIDDVTIGSNLNDDNSASTVLFNHTGSKFMAGLNLRTLLNTSSYWKNVLYYRSSSVDNNFGRFTPSIDEEGNIIDPKFGPYSDNLRNIINNQQEIGYRSIYTKNYKNISITAGMDAMLANLEYARTLRETDTLFVFRSTDFRPNPTQYYQVVNPAQFNVGFDNSAFNGSGYVTLSWRISDKFTLNPGLRYDYSRFNEEHNISPRLSGSCLISDKHSINFAAGIYFQDIAYSDVAAQTANKLKSEESIQGILGYKLQFSPDLKLVAEGWYKQFYNLVVQPNRFQSTINDGGTGYAYGGDINLVKRLSKKWYGQIGYSYMVSKRDNNDGLGEYDYTFSVPHSFNALFSYQPNKSWLFSGKFRYSTGRPTDEYIVRSDVLNNPSYLRYSQEITAINGNRLPDYMALDLRVDYYVYMKRGTFSAFIELGNVNRRFNINSVIFVPNTGQTFDQGLGVFPAFGLRFDL
jgi:CarboxypepD_reg-like domain/TonB dependent receptor/TonB-dependent Receptor Plug Domain